MSPSVLATDYDGTVAELGRVDDETLDALRRWRDGGRALVLVTGRTLDDLGRAFPQLPLFDAVVAENGAVLTAGHAPPRLLCAPVDPALLRALRDAGVDGVAGRAIVGITALEEETARTALRGAGFDRAFVRNKHSAMILPHGVDKGTGLSTALAAIGRTGAEAIAIGDAENDLPMFEEVARAVAVANALPSVMERAERVTRGAAGAGVRELIDALLLDAPTRATSPGGTRDARAGS
jgi:hypothetical protein